MNFKKIRKLAVIDFDDTLVITDAKVRVTNKGLELSTLEFGKYKRENDDVYDLSDFRTGKLKNPRPTEFFKIIFKKIIAGDSDVMILTARPQMYDKEIENFLTKHISLERLIIVGGADTPEKKKVEIEKRINDYENIEFFDDSESNIAAVEELKSPKVKTQIVKN